ncbi:histidine kinase [Lentzea sp. NBRC 105346]|uniref:sensor histidine kinase n=1 Tax=Lentzea sp. NBRC 105346 TaxID=3032205 RepID=UPI002554F187|nr:histidine kinase [Lentzea sp. NBRC 105346]
MAKRALTRVTPIIGWGTLAFVCLWVVVGSFIDSGQYFVGDAISVLGFTTVGALVLSRQPRNWAGILFLTPAFVAVSYVAEAYIKAADQHQLPGVVWAWWLGGWIWAVGVIPPLTVLPFVLPDGRLPPRFWRPVARVVILVITTLIALSPFIPSRPDSPPNPIGIPSLTWSDESNGAVLVVFGSCALLGLASLVHRLVLSKGHTRSQLLWIALGAWLLVLYVYLEGRFGEPLEVIAALGSKLALPIACGIAILRYDLVVLNPLLRQLLLYAVLVTILTASFLVLRMLLGSGALVATCSAVGLALVAPHLHGWLSSRVSRLIYGKRGSPAEIAAELRQRLATAAGPDGVLSAVADSVARALPVDAVAVVLMSADRELRRVTRGDAERPVDQTYPLQFQGVRLGRIEIILSGLDLDKAERSLLTDLTSTAAPAVAAAHRAEELRRAREQLVVTREQERRRIARDLHDGLGPVLSGVGFTLDALRRSAVGSDNSEALATEARTQLREASQLVRRVVRQLRPTLLDQLGLACALRELAALHTNPTLVVEVHGEELGELTAATEVAAYAIAAEALTNTARHAAARRCDIRLSRHADTLTVTVEDDGSGIEPTLARTGLGLASMVERAEELGGQCQISAREGGGSVVRADLPAGVDQGSEEGPTQPAEVEP